MATEYEYYHMALSQPCRAILLLMKLVNAPHQVNIIDLLKGDNMKPEFLKINPFHKIPAIRHGDFVLTEGPAIARYILNTHKSADHWYPEEPQKRARVDEYLSYQHTNIRDAGMKIFITYFYEENKTGKPTREEDKEEALKNFHDVLKGFEEYFLKDSLFIAGEEISIADLFAISEILQADICGQDYLSAHPETKKWIDRTKASTQPHFDEVFQALNDFVKSNF